MAPTLHAASCLPVEELRHDLRCIGLLRPDAPSRREYQGGWFTARSLAHSVVLRLIDECSPSCPFGALPRMKIAGLAGIVGATLRVAHPHAEREGYFRSARDPESVVAVTSAFCLLHSALFSEQANRKYGCWSSHRVAWPPRLRGTANGPAHFGAFNRVRAG